MKLDLESSSFERNIIGKVSEIDGFKKISYSPANLAREGKQVMLKVTLDSGVVKDLYCSKAVGEKLRAKEIKISHIIGFPITVAETKNGVKYYRIEMPSTGGEWKSIELSAITIEEFVPSVMSYEDLAV